MGLKKKSNWRDGQTKPGIDNQGYTRKRSGNQPAAAKGSKGAKRADDGTDTGGGDANPNFTDADSAPDYSVIDEDDSLTPTEKRRKKMKASMQVGKA